MLELLGESRELGVVGVFDGSGSDQGLKELTLEDNFSRVVNVLSGDVAGGVAIILIFFGEVRVVILLSSSSSVALGFASAVHKIEFTDVSCSEESVGVFRSLDVNTIELSQSSILVDDLAIT